MLTCGPLSILSPAMKHWGPPRRQGLGSHCAHMWAISDFVPVQSIGDPPRRQGLGSHYADMWAKSDFVPVQSIRDPRDGRG